MEDCRSIQNPEAVYKVPPEGIIAKDLLYQNKNKEWKRTGPIKLLPGSVIVWKAEFVGEGTE